MKELLTLYPAPACPMTEEERIELATRLRVACGETRKGLALLRRHEDQWPELAWELDQTLARMTRHLALAEMLLI